MTRQPTDRYLVANRIAMAAPGLAPETRKRFIVAQIDHDGTVAEDVRWMLDAMDHAASSVDLLA